MRTFLICAALAIFCFSSCKKDGIVAQPDSLTATIDGVNRSFNTGLMASLNNTSTGPGYELVILDTGKSYLGIALNTDKPITTGTYTYGPNGTNGVVTMSYSPSPNNHFVSDVFKNHVTSINITSISSSRIQGTFSAELVRDTDLIEVKTIADGKFNIKLTQ